MSYIPPLSALVRRPLHPVVPPSPPTAGQTDIVLEACTPLGNPGNNMKKEGAPNILEDPVMKEVAEKHRTTVAPICIAFAIHPLPHLVMIPKSVIAARITENLKSTELKLDQEDMRRLRELETKNHRSILGDFFMCPEWGSYQEYMWDTTADEKFEVTEPEAKKQRREE